MKKLIILIGMIAVIIFVYYDPLIGSKMTDAKSKVQSEQKIHLSHDAERLLEKNGFVVIPSKSHKDMNDVYKMFHMTNIPIFVTTDSILHTTHLLFDRLLRITEVNYLMDDLKLLTRFMINTSLDDYITTENPEVKNAIYANIAFFSVASSLLDEKMNINMEENNLVEAELKLIRKHKGFKKSPVLSYLEDYSQYVPRGHYTRTKKLESYFKVMMWYGRMGFYLNPSNSLQLTELTTRRLTRQALLIVRALSESSIKGMAAWGAWERIYETTTFFAGKTDDLDVHDYKAIALKTYGKIPGIRDLADESKLEQFISEARKSEKPNILPISIADTEDNKKGVGQIVLGLKFMGQRFIPDSYIFQNLVYPKVKLYTGNSRPFTWVMSQMGPIRGVPRGLDIMAVLGSKYAEDIIRKEGDSDYGGYNRQLEKLKEEFDLKREEWSSNLYWSWLYNLNPLLSPSEGNVPSFMGNKAWTGKVLQTALGSWTELRHDLTLYTKQSYTMIGTALSTQLQLTYGYVEPYPEVYARVRDMIERMKKGLVLRGFLDKEIQDKLERYEKVLDTLEVIAIKQLTGRALTEKEYKTIWNIGSALQSVIVFPRNIMAGIISATDDKMAIIVDVHTDTNSGKVLEDAVGFPFIIYVKVLIDGKERIVQGPVFSYYEFKQPISERLSDEKWQEMLEKGKEHTLPKWTRKFISNN